MKHIAYVEFQTEDGGWLIFGVSIAASIDNPGMLRLIVEDDGFTLGDMYETEDEAIDALCCMGYAVTFSDPEDDAMYPGNVL